LYPLVGDLGGKVASLAFYVVMARKLGAGDFGVFTFALAFGALVTTVADFEQDKILTREVARDPERIHRYFANTLALKLAIAVPSIAVGIGILWVAGASSATLAATALLSTAVLVELMRTTVFASFQSFERLEFVPIVLISQRYVTAGAGISALYLGAGVVTVSAIYLAGAILGLVLASSLFAWRVVRPRLSVDPRFWWWLIRASFALGLAGAFSAALFRVDTTMLAGFETDEVVGNYGAAYRLFETTLFVSWSVGAAVYPAFARLTRGSTPPIGPFFERALKLAAALTFPLAIGAAILAEPLIELLYGHGYPDAPDALVLLAPAIALYPLGYVTGYLLVGQDRQRVLTYVYGAVALENIALNFVLIPAFSLEGAAIGTSLSQLLVTVSLVYFARRTVGRIRFARVLVGPAFASAGAAVLFALFRENVALAAAAGGVVYVVLLLAFERVVYPDDASAIREIAVRRRRP
jgi:O-antigen/teichoic acid export membrane protein